MKIKIASPMTKTPAAVIGVTLMILVGASIHFVQRNNQEAVAPAKTPQESKDTNPVSTGESRATDITTQANTPSPFSSPAPAAPEATAYLNRLKEAIQLEKNGLLTIIKIDKDVVNEMDRMPLDTLVRLLAKARTDDRYKETISSILEKILAKSPAAATTLTAELVIDSSPFDKGLSCIFGEYFRDWLETDRAAADRWYFAAMASGKLIPKSPPEAGRKFRPPAQILMLNRFKVMLNAGSEQAIIMAEEMSDEEIAYGMNSLRQDYRDANTSPGFISRIVRNLRPEKQVEALQRYVDFMAQKGFADGSRWLEALDIADSAHAELLGRALLTAVIFNRLPKSEALEIIDGWPDSSVRDDVRRKIKGR